MRKLATIRRVSELRPIQGADKICLAIIDGWQCVVGNDGSIKAGPPVVYFEIDSALPYDDARYEFLKERCGRQWKNKAGDIVDQCIRIRTIKLRGQISQGLVMQLDLFPEIPVNTPCGTDVTELLHVRHYDDVHEAASNVLGANKISSQTKGTFPSHLVPKTDEERLQNMMILFHTCEDVEFECTEKNDGSSMTVIWSPSSRPDDPLYVCSRNQEIKPDETNVFWQMVNKYKLDEYLKDYTEHTGVELALQGELVGPGINGNRDMYTEPEFHVFRIWKIKEGCWVDPDERAKFCSFRDIPHVPVMVRHWKVFETMRNIDHFLEYVKGKTARGHEREGMVFKSYDGSVSFKVINNDYLLKEK